MPPKGGERTYFCNLLGLSCVNEKGGFCNVYIKEGGKRMIANISSTTKAKFYLPLSTSRSLDSLSRGGNIFRRECERKRRKKIIRTKTN